MAQTMRSAALDTRGKRLSEKVPSGRQHMARLSSGRYLAYYRPAAGGCGWWTARWYDPSTRKFRQRRLASADDFQDANGGTVLSWSQAQKAAEAFFDECENPAPVDAPDAPAAGRPVTVADALVLYMSDARRQGHTSVPETQQRVDRLILPALGSLEVASLSRRVVADWHLALAESPRRRTGQRFSQEGAWGEDGPTDEQRRARRSSANRVLAILKRALSMACEEHGITPGPWRDVRPFPKVGGVRVRFLSLEEQERLVAACAPDFRLLVIAGLYTGSRYAALTRVRAADFNPGAGTLWIARDKGGTARHIVLTPNAVSWFTTLVEGLAPDDLLFRRSSVARTTRASLGTAWGPYDQAPPMRAACATAGIDPPITFHELRHTYASALVNDGVPLAFVAAQLGHVDTRMVERHYGHLCANAKAASIRSLVRDVAFQ